MPCPILTGSHASGQLNENIRDMNPFDHMREFLVRSGRYSVLNIRGTQQTANSQNKKRLLYIKDVPAMVYTRLESWQDLLM